MNTLSPWAIAAKSALASTKELPIYAAQLGHLQVDLQIASGSLWARCKNEIGEVAFRIAYSPDHALELKRKLIKDQQVTLTLTSIIGNYRVEVKMSEDVGFPILQYHTTFTPTANLLVPFWPRDIVFPGSTSYHPTGEIHVRQVGTRSGQLHFTLKNPELGSIFYLQNLTALADYNEDTHTSAGNLVGGEWPEIGLALPPTADKPLQKGKKYTLTDAIIVFDKAMAENEAALTTQYLDLLAAAYLKLPRPQTKYYEWQDILQKGLHDLMNSPGCWSQVAGNHYLNAYVCDYETPPEIMVQLAVLLPLVDYVEWSHDTLPVMKTIKNNLPEFWDQKLKTIVRWLPAAADQLKGEEEQKLPMVMDSWYLNHPLLNLSRLALKGDQVAAKLFLDSLPYAIKVAKHFEYNWPVFYKMDTLEVVKLETKEGEGGQHDVAGLYAHVVLQAYELTGESKYLKEAERAAQSLKGKGFKLFYQANNTAFAAGALLRLYKHTKKQDYLDLSYLCLAGVFQNCQLWDCNYGYGKHLPTFFALFPLSDAPYTAVYEEQEVFCALHNYLEHAKGVDILRSVKLLCNEYIRNLINRAPYYYPTMLSDDMLSEDVKMGEVDRNIYIALEDLQDGWEQSGQVGQEVYGAGNAFGILPRHYHKIKDQDFMLYADYPITGLKVGASSATFDLGGIAEISCRLRILPAKAEKLVFQLSSGKTVLTDKKTKEGHLEFVLLGNQKLELSWSDGAVGQKPGNKKK